MLITQEMRLIVLRQEAAQRAHAERLPGETLHDAQDRLFKLIDEDEPAPQYNSQHGRMRNNNRFKMQRYSMPMINTAKRAPKKMKSLPQSTRDKIASASRRATIKRLSDPAELAKYNKTRLLIKHYAIKHDLTRSEVCKMRSDVIKQHAKQSLMRYQQYVQAVHAGEVKAPPHWPLCLK